MGNGDDSGCFFPLTGLQIGDLQSYLSDLSLFLANESKKFYILVDNRPYLGDLGSRRAQIWQLVVTKSRLSPFAKSKSRRERKEGKEPCSRSNSSKAETIKKWFAVIDAARLSRKRVLLPVKKLRHSLRVSSELHKTLPGFIVFEVSWSNVRGINYLNELQTDTSLAIEAKVMLRWEFDSIARAASCISSWFSGTTSEQLLLKEYLDSAIGEVFYDAEETLLESIPIDDDDDDDDDIVCNDNPCVEDNSLHSIGGNFNVYSDTDQDRTSALHTPPPPTGAYKRRKVMKSISVGEVDIFPEQIQRGNDVSLENFEDAVEATEYRDVLILSRFNDRNLPFKLRQTIMSDLRLLTLLEAGLPSWVIFLQSYPGFCHLYRPWMCPLARALYVLISIVTVLIGFYDLYKNVPVLKATASRLCGPLLDWIETWEMVSRIKYLGTMLFLHNFEKAVTWFLRITRMIRSFLSVCTQPLAEPFLDFFEMFLPMWNVLIEVLQSFCSVIWVVIESSINLVENLIEILLYPLWFSLSLVWSIATTVLYPVFWILWELLYAPVRMVLALASFIAFICVSIYEMLQEVWQIVSSIFQVASATEATVSTSEISMWRSLWNDLFSQVFRAVRSILNGFVAFFTACNRHRLSIYNHIQKFIQRLFGRAQRSQPVDSRHSRSTYETQTSLRRKEERSH